MAQIASRRVHPAGGLHRGKPGGSLGSVLSFFVWVCDFVRKRPYNEFMGSTTSNPAKLTEVYANMEAAMIVAALEAHGIESHLTGEYTSQFRAESLGNVNILVSDADLARAQEVLRDFGNQGDTNSTDEEF